MSYVTKQRILLSLLFMAPLGVSDVAAQGHFDAVSRPAERGKRNVSAVGNQGDSSVGATTWSGLMPQTRLPQAGMDGALKGSSVTERMDAIRRRPIDADIARPFAADPIESFDAEVKRRPLRSTPKLAPVQPPAQPPAQPPVQPPVRPPVAKPSIPAPPTVPTAPMQVRPIDPQFRTTPQVMTSAVPRPQPRENVLLSNSGPALSFETSGPRAIMIGKRAEYRVTMLNKGSVAATNVICSVKLPDWTDVAAESATTGSHRVESLEGDGNVVRWTIGSIPAG